MSVHTGVKEVGKDGEALESKRVPITNIGHAAFQMRNETEMLDFYSRILGMQNLFTLTIRDALDQYRSRGFDVPQEEYEKRKHLLDRPWITYMKLAERQFVELFHDFGKTFSHLENRRAYYGYTKLNFEVDSIQEIRDYLVEEGVGLKEDIHTTVDGSVEISLLDPDGNEIQFTEYGKGKAALLTLAEDKRIHSSKVKYTTQIAFQVKNSFDMLNFYTRGLGLKNAAMLTYGDLYDNLIHRGFKDERILGGLKTKGDHPWIHYIEVGPHQYIELFQTEGQEKQPMPKLSEYDGYQHLCLEVSDIQAAREACVSNGLKPDTEISLGPDGAYQFWLTDPDGNRLELMEYTPAAGQLKKTTGEQ